MLEKKRKTRVAIDLGRPGRPAGSTPGPAAT